MAWPNGPDENPTPMESKELTWWTVKTLDKKSVTEVEEFVKDDMMLTHTTGFRWGSWQVATNDSKPPKFVFENGQLDMNSCYENNIEEVELNSMDDGWFEDIEWSDNVSDEEQEKAQEVIDEESVYELESHGWMHSETYVYVSGPLEITNEAGEVIQSDIDENLEQPVAAKDQTPVPDNESTEEVEGRTDLTDWFHSEHYYPTQPGRYQVTSYNSANWPFPTFADWDGKKWSDDKVISWRGLLNDPTK